MRLSVFFDRIGPYLEGRATTDETRRLLYGEGQRSTGSAVSGMTGVASIGVDSSGVPSTGVDSS